MELEKRRSVDLLVEEFWKKGYFTLSRKFGTYLPEPQKVGKFDIDIVARYKSHYAIGITLYPGEIKEENFLDKIKFLATRKTRYTKNRVILFIGVLSSSMREAKFLIDRLEPEIRKNIKLFPIVEKSFISLRHVKERTLFS